MRACTITLITMMRGQYYYPGSWGLGLGFGFLFFFPRSVTNRRLVSRAHASLVHAYHMATSSPGVPFVMRWESGPLARSNDIPVLNGFVNTIDWYHNRFIRLDSGHAQSYGESLNRGLPVLDLARGPQQSNECACLSHARAIERAWEWVAPFP